MDFMINSEKVWEYIDMTYWRIYKLNEEIDNFQKVLKIDNSTFISFWLINWKYTYLFPNTNFPKYEDYIKNKSDINELVLWINLLTDEVYKTNLQKVGNIAFFWWTFSGKSVWITNIIDQFYDNTDTEIIIFEKWFFWRVKNNKRIKSYEAFTDDVSDINNIILKLVNDIKNTNLEINKKLIILDEFEWLRKKISEINPSFDEQIEFLLKEGNNRWVKLIIWSYEKLPEYVIKNVDHLFIWRNKYSGYHQCINFIFKDIKNNVYLKFPYFSEEDFLNKLEWKNNIS